MPSPRMTAKNPFLDWLNRQERRFRMRTLFKILFVLGIGLISAFQISISYAVTAFLFFPYRWALARAFRG